MWTNTDNAVLATMDAIKSICELLNAKGVVSLDEFGRAFEHQAKAYLRKKNPDGAAVMILLLQYLGRREAAETLLRAKPQGTA